MTDIASINLWHKRARPEPTERDFNVQLGCHFEEIAEMMITLDSADAVTRNKMSMLAYQIMSLAEGMKRGVYVVDITNRKEFLDAICDQVVTAVGSAYCAGMDVVKAVGIVSTSNWSKYGDDGQPFFDENGKIKKGPSYTPPHLDECV